jgi:phosphatidylserine decarboxylase
MEIKIFNRKKDCFQEEKVYGQKIINWLYGTRSGYLASSLLCSSRLSKLYGAVQNSELLSQHKVKKFIKDFNIEMKEFEFEEGGSAEKPFSNFNSFFVRKFKEGERVFPDLAHNMGAFAEGRYLGFESIGPHVQIPVKGKYLDPVTMISNDKWGDLFLDGPLLIGRLCPSDYHRFHFPDNGQILDFYKIPGELHSVNPWALKRKEDIFLKNERHVTILDTENFGKLAYIEVGAMMVGKIVQSFEGKTFLKGQEKGYFLFGGSTVIVVGEKGKWSPSGDILNYSKKGVEVFLKLGDIVSKK